MARVEEEASSLWRELDSMASISKTASEQIARAEKEKDQCNGAGVSL